MVKLPDSSAIPTVGLRGQRPGARIDSAPIAAGGEAIGQAVMRGGVALGGAEAAGGNAEGQAIVQGGEQMAAAERQGGAALASGIQTFGKGVENLGAGLAEFKIANDRLDYARAQSEFRTKKIELDSEFANDTQYDTLKDRYTKRLTEIRQTTSEMVGNESMRERFVLDTDPTLASGVATASQTAFNGLKSQKVAASLKQLDDASDKIMKTADPEERAGLIKSANGIISELRDGGFIDPIKAQQLSQKWTVDAAKSIAASKPDEEQINMLREAPNGREAVVNRTLEIEGRGKDPNSSAVNGFINSTWLATLKAHRPDIAKGRSDEQLLALRNDTPLLKEMTGYLQDDNAKALRDEGVVPTPTTLYLAHFLGAQGAADVMNAKPGTPIDEVLEDSAIEANRKVLAGKTTDSVIAWAQQKMGGATRGRGDVIDFIPEIDRVNLLNSATARLMARQEKADSETAIAQDNVKEQVEGDISQIRTYGTGDDKLTPDLVRSVYGSKGVIDWQDRRNDAHAIWLNTHDLYSMSDDKIVQRMASILPKQGDADFVRKAAIYKTVSEQVDALRKRRMDDPAASVGDDPVVKQAAQALDPKDPTSVQALVKARLVAQEHAGIQSPVPVTKTEAQSFLKPLNDAVQLENAAPSKRGEVSRVVQAQQQLVQTLKGTYGQYADKVMVEILRRAAGGDKDQAEAAGEVMSSLIGGKMPGARATASLAATSETAAASKAFSVSGMIDDAMARENAWQTPTKPAPKVKTPSLEHIQILMNAPEKDRAKLAALFNKHYGEGAAEKYFNQAKAPASD